MQQQSLLAHRKAPEVMPVIVPSRDSVTKLEQFGRKHIYDTSVLFTDKKRSRETNGGDNNNDLASTVRRNFPFSEVAMTSQNADEDSNDSTDEFSILLQAKSPLKKQQPADQITNRARIEKVSESLLRTVTIVSPFRFNSVEFAEALKIFRYDRKKGVFGELDSKLEQCNNYTFRTLVDIFTNYKSGDGNQFYVLFNRSCLYFTRRGPKKLPVLAIYSENEQTKKSLKESNINFESHWDSMDPQMITIINMNIIRYWNKFINEAISKDLGLEIVSNFKFFGCYQSLPQVVFNGAENLKRYDYLREKMPVQTNILDLEPKHSLYNAKLDGYFMRTNLEALNAALQLKSHRFEMTMQPIKQSEHFRDMLSALNRKQ